MPTWPASLPQSFPRRVDGVKRIDGREMFEPDTGPPIAVRRMGITSRIIPLRLVLTTTQRATLETFVVTTLGGGISEFDWTNPWPSAGAVYFRFVDLPSDDWIGTRRFVSFSLRTRAGA